ncbi:HindVP family restriction endonuclease [Mycetocola sp. JXN-3]|uniref:HindVP family restriction endonuclease n=1 Tax=Mycetocola sp. JXN-3 TaxID=2116510 RepID=UPI00165D172A|nr:HindVP family restriction endonuclease [Mycetocola sp. JXN-3]
MKPFLYGLDHASHDFRESSSLGKNIFTNAFPLSLAQYLANVRGLPIPIIRATTDADSRLTTKHEMTEWSEILGTSLDQVHFEFEGVYSGYNDYTHTSANKSDVVVIERASGRHLRPLEIKLVVVPTSSTARRDRKDQSCEIVVRPSTVEQLAFSIAHSYGASKRSHLQKLLVDELGQPSDYKWSDEKFMIEAMPRVLKAAENVIRGGLDVQTPLVLTAIWRSEGQKPVLEEHAFDVFAWTDMAFTQLFIDQVRREHFSANGIKKQKAPTSISRPSRALVWLVRSLLDYAIQNTLNFGSIHSEITFGVQSDKAGSFSGEASLKHLRSPEFLTPRVTRSELGEVLSPSSAQFLMPERRLDAAIAIQHLAEELSREADIQD